MVKVSKSGNVGESPNRCRVKKNILTCLKVSIFLGLGWVLVFPALYFKEVWPIMQVVIELQGFFIVIAQHISWKCVQTVRSKLVSKTSNKNKISTLSQCRNAQTQMSELSLATTSDSRRSSDVSII